jgi:hypothetical protein
METSFRYLIGRNWMILSPRVGFFHPGAVVQTIQQWGQLGLRELVGNYWFLKTLVSGTSDRGFKSHPPHYESGMTEIP